MLYKILFTLIIFTIVNIIQSKVVTLYAFSTLEVETYYGPLINKFHEYAKKNGLDITVRLTYLENDYYSSNTTESDLSVVENIATYLNKIPSNEEENIDIVTYDLIYNGRLAEYFIDLNPYFNKEKISKFIPSSIETCTSLDKKLISLPLYTEYGVLAYNEDLLNKYNKPVPKTWDELIETAKFIVKSEKEAGNEITGYASQHMDTESATCTSLEIIYSGRKNRNDPCPSLLSDEAIKSIEVLKRMIDSGVATTESLGKYELEVAGDLYSGKLLFGRNWQFIGKVCTKETVSQFPFCNAVINGAPMPGLKEGISASVAGGQNIAISKNSKNVEEAVKVIDFLTSIEVQREFIYQKLSALPELYSDPEICSKIDCELLKSLQPVTRPSVFKDYEGYSTEFRTNVKKAIKGEISFKTALLRTRNLVRYINIEIKSFPSILVNTIAIILFIGCLLSAFFVFCYYSDEHLDFISTNYWYTYCLGCVLILVYVILNVGKIKDIKCQFRFWLLMCGYGFVNIPIFARLIGNYPKNYGLPNFIRENMVMVVNFLLFLEMGIGFLWEIIAPFKTEVVRTKNEYNESYCKCDNDSILADIFFNISVGINILMGLGMAYFMIIEWKFPKYYLDLRVFSVINVISLGFLVFQIVLKYITIKNLKLFYFLHTLPELFFVAYMTLVVFGFKFYCIQNDIPAEKKTIYSNKSDSKGQYGYKVLPEDTLTNKSNSTYSSNYSSNTKYSKSSSNSRSTTVDHLNSYSNYSDITITSPNQNKFINIPNADNAPAIISNSFQYPENLIPQNNPSLFKDDDYDYMNVESLLKIMKN